MRVSLTGLVRFIVFGFLGLNLVAITVGRMFPEGPNGRRLRSSQETQVNSFACTTAGSTPHFLDAESCNIRKLVLPAGDRLVNSRCSPWVDEAGESQVVGQWSSLSASGRNSEVGTVGLARFTFPSGQPLDRIETNVYPASPPCWLPGTAARVLFAGGDGRLYRFDFEDEKTRRESSPATPRVPVQLTWKCPVPGEGSVFVGDPFLTGTMGADNCVFVSLNTQIRSDGRIVPTPSALWWLKLDHEASTIIEAGPVFTDAGETNRFRRFPTIASRPGLGMVIAHLSRDLGESTWKLEVAPLRFDPNTKAPSATTADLKIYARGCAPTAPAFSNGGHWISCVFPGEDQLPRGVRLPIHEADFQVGDRPIEPIVDDHHSDSFRQVRVGGEPSSIATGGSSQRSFGETRSTYPTSLSDLTSAM